MAPLFPISVKAVVRHQGRVVLLKNERNEWELPGGRLETAETLEQAVARELENDPATFKVSDEHQEMGWFAIDDLGRLNFPNGYRRSIERAP